MLRRTSILALVALASAPGALCQAPEAGALPAVDGRTVVARVNDVPIYLDDLLWNLAGMHAGMEGSERPAEMQPPDDILDRMIDVELVRQEAQTIGLDTLPEFVKALEDQRKRALRDTLVEREHAEPPPPSDEEVERAYAAVMRRVRMDAMLLPERDEAEAFRTRVAEGGDLGELAREQPGFEDNQLISSDRWIALAEVYPEVAEAVALAEPGTLSDVIEVPGRGFAVVRLVEAETPEDPAEREAARERVAAGNRARALREYKEAVARRLAVIDREALEALDLEIDGVPFERFLVDDRVLARFDNVAPLTVGDLARGLLTQFFHGPEKAKERGEINVKKLPMFESLVQQRALEAEAVRLGIEDTPEFRARMQSFESVTLFGLFVDRVITRDLRAYRDDLLATYEKYRDRFQTPTRVRIDHLVFLTRNDAEEALARLRRGSDFDWVRTNTPGIVAGDALDEYWSFPTRSIQEDQLPEAVVTALEGATDGEFRIASEGDRAYHVIRVLERIPGRIPSFDEVRPRLGPLALGEMRDKALKDYIAALRESGEIEVFARGERLRSEVMRSLGRAG